MTSSETKDQTKAPGGRLFLKNGCQLMMGKIFEIEFFVLKCVLDHSESIPTKKSGLCHCFDLWPHFSKKMSLSSDYGEKFEIEKIENFSKKIVWVGIDLEWSKKYFKTNKNIDFEKFSPLKFFFRDIAVFFWTMGIIDYWWARIDWYWYMYLWWLKNQQYYFQNFG